MWRVRLRMNRDWLFEGNIVEAFLQEVLKAAEQRGLLSDGCRVGTAEARCTLTRIVVCITAWKLPVGSSTSKSEEPLSDQC